MYMQEEKEIELRTEEVNELLTATPRWIVRWGVTIIFSIFLLALTLSFFIRYPDTLPATAVITTLNPPVTLVAVTSGSISQLKTKNNVPVKKGDVLMVIGNTANYQTILAIDSLLGHIASGSQSNNPISIPGGSELPETGELTPAFITFLNSYNDYKLFMEVNPQLQEIRIIDKELEGYQQLQEKYQSQENIYREEFSLIENDYNRYSSLLTEQSIAIKEFEDKKRDFLTAKRNYETMKITTINNRILINDLEKSKLQLQMQAYREKEHHRQELDQSAKSLKALVEGWEHTYLLKAPIDGTVSLFSFWTVNQNIRQGDEVLSIVPSEKQEVIARLSMPVQNSGKLRQGQTVNIRLNNYQFREYGMLKGTIKAISQMPKNDTYSIEVSLPGKLITTYHRQLDYKEDMHGTADVITEDLSVSDRIFNQFRKIISR
jgi:multidrug resistance efflux pump